MLLSVHEITKQYPENKLRANDNISISFESGKIHALLGENGAGKSTLVKILAGQLEADSGQVSLFHPQLGTEVKIKPGSPDSSRHAGIAIIPQHQPAAMDFTVLEQLLVGNEQAFVFSKQSLKKRAEATAVQYKLNIPFSSSINRLNTAQLMRVNLLGALLEHPRFLILDEPGASLDDEEQKHLLSILENLKHQGIGVILISHKLKDSLSICDDISILQKGKLIYTGTRKECPDTILHELLGKLNLQGPPSLGVAKKSVGKVSSVNIEGKVLSIEGINCILCNSGPDYEFLETTLAQNISHSAFIPGQTETHGVYKSGSLADNVLLHRRKERFPGLLKTIDKKLEQEMVNQSTSLFLPEAESYTHVDELSGGMTQKLVLSRELSRNTELTVLCSPGRKIDSKGRTQIYDYLKNQNGNYLIVTSDIDEALYLGDSLHVFYHGELISVEPNADHKTLSDIMLHGKSL